MGEDEDATIRTLTSYRELMFTLIQKHRGRVVDSPGDNLLAEFLSVVDAVRCAVEIQEELRIRNAELPEERRMEFRIGINLGDVVQEGERIYGDGVNITARVEGLAEGGGICISGTVYDSIKNKLTLSYESLGEHSVKNIKEPVRVYRMRVGPDAVAPVVREEKAGLRAWHKAATAVLAVLIVAVGAWAIWHFYFRPPPIEPVSEKEMAFPLPDKPSVAVLPFANIGDPAQEYIADGITEQIITALGRNPWLFVIASNSTFTYKGKPVKVQQVSRELGVRYVVEGSVQKSGDRIRITAQLIDATRGEHMWAENYERDLKDLFAVQDEIMMKILRATRGKLLGWGEQSREKGTTNLEAYFKFLKARSLAGINKPNNRMAMQICEESTALDPQFAEPYSLLGITYLNEVFNGWSQSPGEDLKKAVELAQKAISLDQALLHPHHVLGWVYLLQGKHDDAVAEGEKAVALIPNSSFANGWLCAFLAWADRPDEAILVSTNVLRLNPFPTDWELCWVGVPYVVSGRYEEALEYYKRAQERNPDNLWPYFFQASIYANLARQEEAQAAAKELLRVNPRFSIEFWEKWPGCKNRDKWNLIISGLRKAGLPETPPLPLPDKPSIAVLPFKNMSGDPEQEYFSDGITEEIITALSKTPKLFVIARNSTFTYKGKPVKSQQVGHELGVKYILEGSVRKGEDRVRITAQLVDASTGKHLWAERYDRDMRDVFAVQDEITRRIIVALQVELTEGEQARLYGKATDNLDAYLLMLQAREQFYRMNKQGSMRARELAKEAIVLDEKYATPYAILALTHMMDLWFRFAESPQESMRLASEAAHKALALDDSDPSVYTGLCMLYIMQREHEKAVAAGERAVSLSPSGASAHSSLGTALLYAGREEEAIALMKKAIDLDPFPPSIYLRNLGSAYRLAGRYEEAITEYKKSLQENPDDLFTHLNLAVCYVSLGREEEARAEAAEVLRIHPGFSLEHFAKTLPFKRQSVTDDTIASLRKTGLK